MRAVRVVRHGRPTEVIEVQDIPVPDVEPGGVRVAVSAAAVNFGDIARCRGGIASVMAQPPFTLGMDVCGVVDAAGAGAEEWIGRRVVAMCALSFGGMADAALAPVSSVFDAPSELDVKSLAQWRLTGQGEARRGRLDRTTGGPGPGRRDSADGGFASRSAARRPTRFGALIAL